MNGNLRSAWVEVDLAAIAHNVRALRGCLPTGTAFMAVVKADGYGHGAEAVARVALASGATWLGVALVEELTALRRTGLTAPGLILGAVAPDQAEQVVAADARVALFDLELARSLDAAARRTGRRIPVHLKIDTGMGRVGIRPEAALDFARAVAALPGLAVEGVFTHFACADEPASGYTALQITRFRDTLATLDAAGIRPALRHAANSAAIMLHPDSHLDLVRAGIAMYGLAPDAAVQWPVPLRPAMTVKTRIAFLKTLRPGEAVSYGRTWTATGGERVATIPVGYADGFRRLFSNQFSALVGGRRCPVIGRVCMDQTVIRLPDDVTAQVGDDVVLLGRQGDEAITADDWARQLDTINYEIVCLMSPRLPRVHHPESPPAVSAGRPAASPASD